MLARIVKRCGTCLRVSRRPASGGRKETRRYGMTPINKSTLL